MFVGPHYNTTNAAINKLAFSQCCSQWYSLLFPIAQAYGIVLFINKSLILTDKLRKIFTLC